MNRFADRTAVTSDAIPAPSSAAARGRMSLPVDDAVPEALFRASVKGNPSLADPVHHEIEAICAKHAPGRKVVALAGADFYARVRSAYAIVATGEPRLYANIIIRKGVIYPPESPET